MIFIIYNSLWLILLFLSQCMYIWTVLYFQVLFCSILLYFPQLYSHSIYSVQGSLAISNHINMSSASYCVLSVYSHNSPHRLNTHMPPSVSLPVIGNFNCLDVCFAKWADTAQPFVITVSPSSWSILVSLQYFTRISSVHPHSPPIFLFNWMSSSPSSPLRPSYGTHLKTPWKFYIASHSQRERMLMTFLSVPHQDSSRQNLP